MVAALRLLPEEVGGAHVTSPRDLIVGPPAREGLN